MGGYGSTRWEWTRVAPLISDARRLDIASLRRIPSSSAAGPRSLDPIRACPPGGARLRWGMGGNAAVILQVLPDKNHERASRVSFSYRARVYDGPWRAYQAKIAVDWRPCNLGGHQPFFRCPSCDRPCRTVFVLGPTACRKCHGLAYDSTRQSEDERAIRAAWTAYRRLDPDESYRRQVGSPGVLNAPTPPKRIRMHQTTYRRLCREWRQARERAQLLSTAAVLGTLARLSGDRDQIASAAQWREAARQLTRSRQ